MGTIQTHSLDNVVISVEKRNVDGKVALKFLTVLLDAQNTLRQTFECCNDWGNCSSFESLRDAKQMVFKRFSTDTSCLGNVEKATDERGNR